jgi:hypothetical protein
MTSLEKVSTGLAGLDKTIDNLRLGDNVVWKVDTIADYKKVVDPYVTQSGKDGRKLIYVRFGIHEPLFGASTPIKTYQVRPEEGFENFVSKVHRLIRREGRQAFYVFDCLTDLLEYWYSDVMVKNFFQIICPYLYKLETIAYFALIRNIHTFGTIAGIRETTQLLLNLFQVQSKLYVHPLKVWKRYSSSMFLPHLIEGQETVGITASSEAADLLTNVARSEKRTDYWDAVFNEAKKHLSKEDAAAQKAKRRLMAMLIGTKSRIFELCDQYFTLSDILAISDREIGTGFIGGKSVGMLLARKALITDGDKKFGQSLEPHDSYYIGSNIFYTYIVQNGWWEMRIKQKTKDGYYKYAARLKDYILRGKFSEDIQEQFMQMLEYFGQSPIIVRSSSLLEDNFGNAFSGKYESVFCVNQGTPEERYLAFEKALKTVYASTMNEDALAYRMARGLFEADEQMAILVQRVSGDYFDENFFPHVAGVGNSMNLYVWNQNTDMYAGMLRLVFGLGTRAVDRTTGDYVRIMALDDPLRLPPADLDDQSKFAQHSMDLLSIRENRQQTLPVNEILSGDIKTDKSLFAAEDRSAMARMRDLGVKNAGSLYSLDFKKLLRETGFAPLMKDMLAVLAGIYNYPVDIEFTANFNQNGDFKVNLLQCRPLQTTGMGRPVEMPEVADPKNCFFSTRGNFMGGNIRLPVNYVVLIDTQEYLRLPESDKYALARLIGRINAALKGENIMLVGPGRWGTTTPSIGVPVHFSEISNMKVLCEVAAQALGFMPELSYGSHFFQDLVEMEIFYAAIFADRRNVLFNPAYVKERPNLLPSLCPDGKIFPQAVHVCQTDGMEIFSDVVTQKVVCR